jgi:hypothetical protein
MLHLEGKRFSDGLTRRDFLRVGSLGAGAVGLGLSDLHVHGADPRRGDVNCILLFLVGGPSHLDTFDLKPDAPAEVRGPFRPIRSQAPGVDVCEHLPRLAKVADRVALLRSVHHTAAAMHEPGHQMMQTGRLFRHGVEYPHYGAVLSHLRGPRSAEVPPFVVLPKPIGNTGICVSHGQGAGWLGPQHEPLVLQADPAVMESPYALLHEAGRGIPSAQVKRAFDLGAEKAALRERYGRHTFGQSCLLARRLIEHGVRLTTVNMFDCVFNEVTWDCHADGGSLASDLNDYRDTLCPMFDQAYAALLTDLEQRGLLSKTLVLALGEFGRTPHLNPRGGRDHWPGCWTVLFAGGGVRGGQVVGSSDAIGAEPKDRPVTPADVAATVYHALGLDPATTLSGPEGQALALSEGQVIGELFR